MSQIPVPGVVPIYPPPAQGITVGTNAMRDVPFPVIAGDHYFHGYSLQGRLVWDVFMWHPNLNCPMYEARASLPAVHGAWESGGGGLVFSSDDDFEMRLAPSPTTHETYLELRLAGTSIRMDEHGVTTGGLNALSNVISNCFGGFRFDTDGGVAIGVTSVPEGMLLVSVQTAG